MAAEFDIETLKFDDAGLIPAIAQQHDTGEVLMMAWMNRDALKATLETKQVTYWSRSRQELWRKGATSGHTQVLKSLRIDCDRDCILMLIDQVGAACHTMRRHCFYTDVTNGQEVELISPMES
ncbi:phosphoribosyl-AMP cyclohydrolase [Amylibacter ulvae]|uniref:Phosphoribosyl-AMP cyclohydrolase n=1 Tax=Paramylibacter ulvae TaxID=1651968 RepID=A0ABQ3CU86_9RHOB|nr:phosphoribosyl-AMP cyclohydrolase [Amylibacter ulvae]GHA42208.1 phosphoribosyl-AMP cyclohydrolase [Amylibacter ulvae]